MHTRVTHGLLGALLLALATLRLAQAEVVSLDGRTYYLEKPASIGADTVLVVHCRWADGNASGEFEQLKQSGKLSNAILACPEASGQLWNWSADKDFVKQVLDALMQQHGITRGRVLLSGHSSGANFAAMFAQQNQSSMAHALIACGWLDSAPVQAANPAPAFHLYHSTNDTVIPYSDATSMQSQLKSKGYAVDLTTDSADHELGSAYFTLLGTTLDSMKASASGTPGSTPTSTSVGQDKFLMITPQAGTPPAPAAGSVGGCLLGTSGSGAGRTATAAVQARPDLTVKQPLFPTMRQYYETPYRKPHLDALIKSYGTPEGLEAASRDDAAKVTARVFVPSTWSRGQSGWGLYVHVPPADSGYLPEGWAPVLAREKLIGVSPNGIGNERDTQRRMRVALDVTAAARREFGLGDKRVFVGGFSGGASIAARLVVEFPDVFQGAVAACKSLPLLDVPAGAGVYPGEYTHVTEETWTALRGHGRRWYFCTGTKDFNLQPVTAQEAVWRKLGLEIRTEVVEGLDHRDPPAASFGKALAFLQAKPGESRPSSQARDPVQVTGTVFWAIPHGTATTLGGPGKATVYAPGPGNAREEIAAAAISYAWNDRRHGLEGTYVFPALALPAKAKVLVEFSLQADLADGNGMHTQTASVVPVPCQGGPGAGVKWGPVELQAKKGR